EPSFSLRGVAAVAGNRLLCRQIPAPLASASHRLHTWLVCRRSTRCEVDSVKEKCPGTQTLERLRSHSRSLSGARPERRLSPIELLPAVAVELAGIGQGRLPRARQHRLRV